MSLNTFTKLFLLCLITSCACKLISFGGWEKDSFARDDLSLDRSRSMAMKQFLFNNSIDGLRVHFDKQPISNSVLIGNISIIENGRNRKATLQIKSDNVYQYKKALLDIVVVDIIMLIIIGYVFKY